MKLCPICKSHFSMKGYYGECSNRACTTILFGDKAIHVEWDKVKALLSHPTLKTNKFAKTLGTFLKDKGFLTSGQLVYVVGINNPKGHDTFQEVVKSRTGKPFDVGKVYKVEESSATNKTNADYLPPIQNTPITTGRSSATTPQVANTPKRENHVIHVTGKEPLYPTKDFKYINYKFESFNPLQSETIKHIEKDVNIVIAASTSSGKTIVAEQFVAPILEAGKIAIYISPLKALAQEKFDDWTDESHTFSKYQIEILTGDYTLTPSRVKKINESNIIILTSEMLDSRTRKIDSEKNEWLHRVGVVIVDEAHLLGMDGRGDNLECALMRFSEQNKTAKIVLLSATMPNVQELANWLTKLNEKDNLLIASDWRPVKLKWHFPEYMDRGYYNQKELAKSELVFETLQKYPEDKFIIFVHTKAMGRMVADMIRGRLHETAEFHSADLTKENRIKLEKSFKQRDGGTRILIATSTLAWGINAPARRVIIAGVTRGMNTVTAMEIIQMGGRSGRYGIDPEGDAYLLVPDTDADTWIEKVSNSENVVSRLTDAKVLSFHVISEVVRGVINNQDDLVTWYGRTLASFQDKNMHVENFIKDIETALVGFKAMKIEDGVYIPTGLGKVSAWMYFQPGDVYNWYNGFGAISKDGEAILDNPVKLSAALSQHIEVFPPQHAQGEIERYKELCDDNRIPFVANPVTGLCLYSMLSATRINDYFLPLTRQVKRDIDRVVQAVSMIDGLYGQWKVDKNIYEKMRLMIQYEVPKELTDICRVKWIGGKKAKELWQAGIKEVSDVSNPKYKHIIERILVKHAPESIASALDVMTKDANKAFK